MGRMTNRDRRDASFERAKRLRAWVASDRATVTPKDLRSTGEEIGIAMIKGDGMPFAEVDLGEHSCAVTVYGTNEEEAEARAARIAAAWNAYKGE